MLQCNTIADNHSVRAIRAALYARVSSEQQAQAGTIDSQVAAVAHRAEQDEVAIDAEARFIDEGHSGATLVRPALERLRDLAAAGGIDRLYVLCRHEQPRNGQSCYDVPAPQWISIAVPAIVPEEMFDAVARQLEENRRRSRQGRRGARYLLQGILACKSCGYAYYGKQISLSGGKGKRRDYGYYRCTGADAYRFGGQRVCQNKQVRQDLLDRAVWNDVRSLLADPVRVEQELRRRLDGDNDQQQRQTDCKLSAQIDKLRRGIARLIDAYGEGLLDRDEFEPRIKSARARLSQLRDQLQSHLDEQARAKELRFVIDNFATFAAQVHAGLDSANWQARREVIRTLVKRVEIEPEQVKVVYRVDLGPFDRSPERGILHYCWRGDLAFAG